MNYVAKAMNYKHHITFKGLQDTVGKLNNSLEKQSVPGKWVVIHLNTAISNVTLHKNKTTLLL